MAYPPPYVIQAANRAAVAEVFNLGVGYAVNRLEQAIYGGEQEDVLRELNRLKALSEAK